MKKKIIPLLLVAIMLLCACGQADTENAPVELEYNELSELENVEKFAVNATSIYADIVKERFPDAQVLYFPSAIDNALAVATHKADATLGDMPVLKYIAECTPGVEVMSEPLFNDNYHFLMGKTEFGYKLQKEFNEWLAVQKENGTVDRMYEFWCSSAEPTQVFDFSELPETNGKIRIYTGGGSRPDVYYSNNRLSGYPIELIYNFCRDCGYGGEINISGEGMLLALSSGKADLGLFFMSYTPERAEQVLYTDPVVEGGVGVLVRSNEKSKNTVWDFFYNGIVKTFIKEDRWKLILSGLETAALITVLGFVLANIFGVTFCLFSVSKKKWLRTVSEVYDRVIQGTPMVVILMILYYVIFADYEINGLWIAIFAFGLTSGASLARQFHVAVVSVDKGQTEAALALGFTPPRAFMGIVFPQAARLALPGYFSEIIGLMKGTSIVGYVSVVDLTKAGDLIRSSTYDAFFPLLSVAFIYFLISWGLLCLLKYFQKKLAPKRVITQEEETK